MQSSVVKQRRGTQSRLVMWGHGETVRERSGYVESQALVRLNEFAGTLMGYLS